MRKRGKSRNGFDVNKFNPICTLCDNQSINLVNYIVDWTRSSRESCKRFGVTEGKFRNLMFPVCEKHSNKKYLPELLDNAEKKIKNNKTIVLPL